MIELDGDYLEGGGALVRVALALSVMTGQEFKVTNIRAGRKVSGLKAQHLTAIMAWKEICSAETNDIKMGSNELWFKPGKIKKGTYEINIGTAGSITLLLQALVLPCLFAPGKITLKIKGGTCGKWQASVDYLQNILLPHLQKFAGKIELKIWKRGYYPEGGGEISLEISPIWKLEEMQTKKIQTKKIQTTEFQNKIPKIRLIEPGQLEQIRGIVNVSAQLEEEDAGEKIKKFAESYLKKYSVPLNIRVEYSQTPSIGGEIVLWAIFSEKGVINFTNPIILGSNALIEKNKSSEAVGKEAAEKLISEIDCGDSVDEHLVDQLIQFMALLPGSEIKCREISKHALTNIYVAEKFLPVKFIVEEERIKVYKYS